ncbi:hypothetical protein MHBO_000496 [Bonamia ostreae]|uniref:Uncharacterized protein n=1 Tax=Bonamia ostreae TaxID=126728 RepID=A0ABV2AFS4_9EUKA
MNYALMAIDKNSNENTFKMEEDLMLMAAKKFIEKAFLASAMASGLAFSWRHSNFLLKDKTTTSEEKKYFQPNSAEDWINEDLKTGDIVLFRRRLSIFRPYKSLLCLATRRALAGDFDHVGVVVTDPDRRIPFVLENGLNGISYTSFEDRVMDSDDKDIAVRFLARKEISEVLGEKLHSFVKRQTGKKVPSDKNEKPKLSEKADFGRRKDDFFSLLKATPEKVDPDFTLFHGLCVIESTKKLKKAIVASEVLGRQSPELDEQIANAEKVIERHNKTLSESKKRYEMEQNRPQYCSASLVAKTLQILELLPSNIRAECYSPDSFNEIEIRGYSQLKNACLPLKNGARLNSVIIKEV